MLRTLNRIIGGDKEAKYAQFFRETNVQIGGL